MASDWTFLTNHSHVLLSIAARPDATLREVAAEVGITERAAQRIMADLVESGYVEAERVGRRNRYCINADMPLRHSMERNNPVSTLVALVKTPGRKSR